MQFCREANSWADSKDGDKSEYAQLLFRFILVSEFFRTQFRAVYFPNFKIVHHPAE